MDKETYEALKRIMDWVLSEMPSEKDKGDGIDFDKNRVLDWIDEVAKEYDVEKCQNKDANGNACYDCESGEGECGGTEKE